MEENRNDEIKLQEIKLEQSKVQQSNMQENNMQQKMDQNKTQATNLKKSDQTNTKVRRIIYYILGILEILFTFRLVFKILGANPGSPFVKFIYSLSNVFISPFEGIFRTAETSGIETKAVLEPNLIIAMIVYAAIAWGIVKLIEISTNRKDSETL